MNYDIIQTTYIHSLITLINEYIKLGWIPVGGICFDGHYYLQAMTKQ
jgi:hypothetical protein